MEITHKYKQKNKQINKQIIFLVFNNKIRCTDNKIKLTDFVSLSF